MPDFDAVDKDLIDSCFGGDPKKYQDALTDGHSDAVSWKDITLSAKTFPELELTAHFLIKELLGYLPPQAITLPHEPFLRSLIHLYRSGEASATGILIQAEEAIKPVRNETVKNHTGTTNDRDLYKKYFEYLPQYIEPAKSRLTGFLGYEPQLEHSLYAEIFLREAMADDKCHLPEHLIGIDMQAITLIKYREILLKEGRVAADNSPLIAVDLRIDNLQEFKNKF